MEETAVSWAADGVESITTWFEAIFDIITGNEFLAACFVAGTIVPIGCYLLRKFRRV